MRWACRMDISTRQEAEDCMDSSLKGARSPYLDPYMGTSLQGDQLLSRTQENPDH